MADPDITMLLALGIVAHVGVAIAAWHHPGGARMVAALNLPIALGTLVYWMNEWRTTVKLGREWHAEDLLVPLFALAATALAAGTLARWWSAAAPNWIVLMVHGLFMLFVLLVGLALKSSRGFF